MILNIFVWKVLLQAAISITTARWRLGVLYMNVKQERLRYCSISRLPGLLDSIDICPKRVPDSDAAVNL